MYGKREEKLNTVEEKQTYICILMRWGGGGGVISRKFLRIGEFACTYLALTLLNLNFPYISETYSINE